jgi:acetylornithine deacetylase/succinyl-diaminopimelate desuccinylase-like protein
LQASDAAHLNDERIRFQNLMAGKRVIKRFLKNLGQLPELPSGRRNA